MARPGTGLVRSGVLPTSPGPMNTEQTSRDDTLVILVALAVMLATLGALVARAVWGV